jgi:hypothetical protein
MTFLHCEVGEEEGQLEEIIVEGFLIAVRCALQVAVIVSWSGSLTPQIPYRHYVISGAKNDWQQM